MADPVSLFLAGILAVGGGIVGVRIGLYLWHSTEDELTFTAVCRAAARAKNQRRAQAPSDHLEREYVDGVDGVMAELMKQGYGDTAEERRVAYLAGGEEVELEA